MTKATETFRAVFVLVSVYIALFTGAIPSSETIQKEILPVVPFWVLVAFGSYALGTLGWDVMTFKNKPEKYHELLKVWYGCSWGVN
jgi:dolichyl-phosphate mannosyltransferase polypeptide 3